MALTREQKQKIFEELREKIKRQKAMVFVDFAGLKVKKMSELRKELKAKDSEFKVAKKNLLRLAFEKQGLELDIDKLKGEIALIFGFGDELSPAKILYQFWQKHQLPKILGGFFENEFREAEDIITLAQIPGRKELLAKLAGTMNAPVSGFVNVLQENIKGLVRVLSAIKHNK